MLWAFEPVKYCKAAPNDSSGTNLGDAAERAEMVHGRGTLVGHGQNVQVAHGFFAAAIAPRGLKAAHRGAGFQKGEDGLGVLVGLGPEHALARLGRQRDAFEDGGFGLLAKAFQPAHLLRLARGAQLVEAVDAELAVQGGSPLGPQAGDAQYGQHTLGHFGHQFVEHGQRASFDQLGDFLGQVLADSLDVGQLPLRIAHDLGDRLGEVADRACGIAIGAHPKRIRPLEFQQIGDLVELVGCFGIGHGGHVVGP